MTERDEIDKLQDELFSRVEKAQGQAFISDGWSGATTKAEWWAWLRERQNWNDKASAIIRQFFRNHRGEHETALSDELGGKE